MTEGTIKPTTMKAAIFRSKEDGKWYWTIAPHVPAEHGFKRPVGPFNSREQTRDDYRNVMGLEKRDKRSNA